MHDEMLRGLPSEIETKRLALRPYRAGDGLEYFALCKNNCDYPYRTRRRPVLAFVNRDLPELAAGYSVDRDHEGKGLVTETLRAVLGLAFDMLGARRARICCNSANLRSIRVAERCGFALEGCQAGRDYQDTRRRPDGRVDLWVAPG